MRGLSLVAVSGACRYCCCCWWCWGQGREEDEEVVESDERLLSRVSDTRGASSSGGCGCG